MKGRIFCYFVLPILLQILLCFATLDEVPHQGDQKQEMMMMDEDGGGSDRRLSRIGSRPPSCQHKCEGCSPCDATQTPANSDKKGLFYANYEPEGWKCKCGTAFFNP